MRFFRCPLALVTPATPLRAVVDAHRRVAATGVTLRDLVERPTGALLEGLATLDAAVAAQRQRQAEREQAKRRARRG